jgi:hypothetical protein
MKRLSLAFSALLIIVSCHSHSAYADEPDMRGELMIETSGAIQVGYRFWLGILYDTWASLDAATLAARRQEFRDDLQLVLGNAMGLHPWRFNFPAEDQPSASPVPEDPRLYIEVIITVPRDWGNIQDPIKSTPNWAWRASAGQQGGAWFPFKWRLQPFACRSGTDVYAPGNGYRRLCSYADNLLPVPGERW